MSGATISFTSTPGRPYTIKLLSPMIDADLCVHDEKSGDAHASHGHNEHTHFPVVQETADNLRGEDEVLSVTADADVIYLSVDASQSRVREPTSRCMPSKELSTARARSRIRWR